MLRLFRLLKIVKERHKISKFLKDVFKIKEGFDRIVFFFASTISVFHTVACLWIILANIEDSPDSWIVSNGF